MVSSVQKVVARYVRPDLEEELRLRAVVAELQATSILRAAGIGGFAPGACAEEKAPTGQAGASGEEGGQ